MNWHTLPETPTYVDKITIPGWDQELGSAFSDQQEPGCAVKKAVDEGIILGERLESYHELNAELAFQSEKEDIGLKRLENKKYKGMQVSAREYREYKERR